MKPALALTLLLAITAACNGGATPQASRAPSDAAAPPSAASSSETDFPTGPAVLVAANYQAPKNKVDSTGAFLPTNGKPTVVWTDAIW